MQTARIERLLFKSDEPSIRKHPSPDNQSRDLAIFITEIKKKREMVVPAVHSNSQTKVHTTAKPGIRATTMLDACKYQNLPLANPVHK